jgi:hypothetical protein
MGTRELLLSVAAAGLLALSTLTVNRLANAHADGLVQRQMEFAALQVAQDLIEEAKNKAFDENVVNDRPTSLPGGFTGGPLGHGATEGYPNFDDVDDYNGLSLTVNNALGQFQVSVAVDYVEDTSPDVPVTSKTFYKRMKVTVTSPYLQNPVEATYVFAFMENY